VSDEINIVSGGYAVCLTCGARLGRVAGDCPVCKQPLLPGSFRLVPGAKRQPEAERKRRARLDP
jgi:hypothetical protein